MNKLVVVVSSLLACYALGCDATPTRCGHVAAPVSVGGERPLTVRAEAGSLWTSAHTWSETQATWAMPASGPVEDVSIRPLADGGHAVTFRQGGLLWRGEVDADRNARGPLRPMPHPVDLPVGGFLTAR